MKGRGLQFPRVKKLKLPKVKFPKLHEPRVPKLRFGSKRHKFGDDSDYYTKIFR